MARRKRPSDAGDAPGACDDDLAAWERATEGVRRLEDPRRGDVRRERARAKRGGRATDDLGALVDASGGFDVTDTGASLRGRAPGVAARLVTRLARGEMPPQARLDLHGYRRDEARGALEAFVSIERRNGRRVLLVVTGRGSPERGTGVLREALPEWLTSAPLARHVLAFATAAPGDGGAGAVYVLLRRS